MGDAANPAFLALHCATADLDAALTLHEMESRSLDSQSGFLQMGEPTSSTPSAQMPLHTLLSASRVRCLNRLIRMLVQVHVSRWTCMQRATRRTGPSRRLPRRTGLISCSARASGENIVAGGTSSPRLSIAILPKAHGDSYASFACFMLRFSGDSRLLVLPTAVLESFMARTGYQPLPLLETRDLQACKAASVDKCAGPQFAFCPLTTYSVGPTRMWRRNVS